MVTQTQSGSKDKKTRILVVDDHPIVCQGLRQLIEAEPDLAICGEAGDAHQAMEAISELKPDLAIVDIRLKDTDGLELIKDIRARHPEVHVLVLSMYEESLYAERVLRAGAKGYVTKEEGTDHLITAIRHVLAGDIYVSEQMSSKMLHEFIDGRTDTCESPIDRLSDRELEVFRLIGQGLGTRQVADDLHLSMKTVETYRTHIKRKLGLRTAAELLQHAVLWVQSGRTS